MSSPCYPTSFHKVEVSIDPQFIVSLVVFLSLHSVPAIPATRQKLIKSLGRRAYLILYSLASLAALVWVFHAALRLDYVELWSPEPWHAWFPITLSPLAFFLLIAGLISPNPVSISFRRGDHPPGAVFSITRHPVLWGFFLWAAGHVIANGDLRSLILFGVLGVFAVFGMITTERRNRRNPFFDSTSVIPFAAVLRGQTSLRIDAAMLIAFAIAALLTIWLLLGGHTVLFGADPLAMAGL